MTEINFVGGDKLESLTAKRPMSPNLLALAQSIAKFAIERGYIKPDELPEVKEQLASPQKSETKST